VTEKSVGIDPHVLMIVRKDVFEQPKLGGSKRLDDEFAIFGEVKEAARCTFGERLLQLEFVGVGAGRERLDVCLGRDSCDGSEVLKNDHCIRFEEERRGTTLSFDENGEHRLEVSR
jgi:hypothetical protein